MNSLLALREAQSCGADEALILDQGGFVTEASGANVFVARDGVLYTPPRESVLAGITRDTVLAIAGERGVAVVERRMTRDAGLHRRRGLPHGHRGGRSPR